MNEITRRRFLQFINHEYISYPFSKLAPDTPSSLASLESVFESFALVVGFALPTTKDRQLMGEMLYDCGGTVVRVRRTRRRGEETRHQVVAGDAKNRRIHGLSGNADSLGNRIIGTAFNCSGARTPWGTVLSAEENFQGSATNFIGVQEGVLPNGSQTEYIPGTSGTEFGLVGEKYGWMVEIDPRNPESRGKKHTALGRFRHENVAMRVKRRKPLVVYLGDDRRGGHVISGSSPTCRPSGTTASTWAPIRPRGPSITRSSMTRRATSSACSETTECSMCQRSAQRRVKSFPSPTGRPAAR